MLCSMCSIFSLPTTALSLTHEDLVVGDGWTADTVPDYYTLNGTLFQLQFGTNAFGTVTDAIAAAEAGDTILVTEGTYSETVVINKNINIVGVQNGVNPNVTGGEFEPWTLNEERGTKETIFTGNIMLGVNGSTVYSDVTDIAIDGIMLTDGGQLRSNCGAAGECNITLNNIYIKNVTKTTSPIYLEAYYGGGNLYKRNVVIKNLRYEGLTAAYGMMLSAESADISGVYMHSDCTKALFDHLSAATVTEDNAPAVTWTVRDSQFCNPVYRVMYAATDNITANGGTINLTESIDKRESVTFTLKNSTFLGCHADTGNGHIVACRPATDNFYFNITDNTFYTTNLPGVNTNPVAGYVTNTSINYGNKVTVTRNRFIGYRYAFSFPGAGDACNVNGNYHEQLDGTVGAIVTNGPVTQTWWYLNRELTARSDGGTVNVSADRLLNLNTDVKFMGRNYTENGVHYFSWTNGGFEFNFHGTGAACTIHSNGAGGTNLGYLNVYVDDVLTKTVTLGATKQSVVLATGLTDESHTVRVVKRTNGRSSSAGVSRIWLEEGGHVHQPDAPSSRKMQFVGDSITVGYGSMGDGTETDWSTATEDGTITYAALTAEYFNAENHTIAVSGRGIVKNVGGDTNDYAPAMYEYTDWRNHSQWDHSNYVPDVIVINYGTNDNSAGVTAADFKAGCKAFVQQVRADNPTSIIIYAYGFMGNPYATQVSEVVSELKAAGDDKVHYLALTPITADEKCLGHPNAAAHADRAQTLIAKVKEVTGWTQETSHNYVSTTTGAATCKNEGQRVKVCSLCGDTVTEAIDTIPHTPAGEIFPDVKPTCGTAGSGYQLCSVCGKVAKTNITLPATGQHSAGAPDAEGNIYCVVCDELISTVPVDGDKIRLETENVLNHYFANGAHQVLTEEEDVVIRPIGGTLYTDAACTKALGNHIAVTPGKATYYLKAADGTVYPLYLYRPTGTPSTHNAVYVDDDFGDTVGKVAFWDGVNVYFVDGGTNAFNTLLKAEGKTITQDGGIATIYMAPGYYKGNADDAINTSVVILGSNHNVSPNVRSADNVWSVNQDRLPETVIEGTIVFYHNQADEDDVSVTIKGVTIVGESSNGPIYIAEGRSASQNKTLKMDIQNNILKGWGTSFNSAAVWANSLCAKSGLIKNNYFEYTAPTGYDDNPDDFCRGYFMRNLDGIVIDSNRFIGYPTVGWAGSEMGDGNTTMYGKNNYIFQNNRVENCGTSLNIALNAAESHVQFLHNDFIGCDNALDGPVIQFIVNELEELPVDFSKIALTVRGNRFTDCNRSVRVSRYTEWHHEQDMRDVSLRINENRFINPAQAYNESTAAVDTIRLNFFCDGTKTPDLPAGDADWDFSRNYFYGPEFETNVNDPARYITNAVQGGKSFVMEESLYTPYYTDYAMTTLSDGSGATAISGVSATPYVGEYDGAAHTITVTAPEGATVSYAEPADEKIYGGVAPAYTEIGTYTVYYKVEKTGVAPVYGSSTVTITKNTSGRTAIADKTATYALGKVYQLDAFADLKDKDTVTYTYGENVYTEMPVFSEVGRYPVTVTVSNPNYVTHTQTAVLVIEKADLSSVAIGDGYEGAYDGQNHTVSVGAVPTDVTVEYSVDGGEWTTAKPTYKDVTDVAHSVTVRLSGVNYVTAEKTVTFNITPATIEGVTAVSNNLTVDGAAKALVTVSGTQSGDTVEYAVGGGAFGTEVPTARRPGVYTVAVKISRVGHWDKILVVNTTLTAGELPESLFGLSIAHDEITDNTGKYTFTWNLGIGFTDAGVSALESKDLKVTAYGVKYAASKENLEEYTFLKTYAQNDEAAAMITGGKVQEFIYAEKATGFNNLYANNVYHVQNTKPLKARYAVFFIRYELDGVTYEEYSVVDSTSNLPGSDISGEETILPTEDILTKA